MYCMIALRMSCYGKWAGHRKTNTVRPPSYAVSGVVKVTDTEGRMEVPGLWGVGGRGRDYRLTGTEFQFCKTKKFW